MTSRLRLIASQLSVMPAGAPPPAVASSAERSAWEREHTSGVSCTIPLEGSPGSKQFGHLKWSCSDDNGAWSNKLVPVVVVHGAAPGRGALLVSGNHGDEYESQIAVAKLARWIDPVHVRGRLIIIPTLSMAAALACKRCWPETEYGSSGTNFNRTFPGADTGGPAMQLAFYVSHILMPLVDVVMDIHTGGGSMRIEPSSLSKVNPDHPRHRERMEAMLAFLTPLSFVWTIPAHGEKTVGILTDEAVGQGKLVVETELGGGTYCPATGHHVATRGLRNVLRHLKVLVDEAATSREALGLPPTNIVFTSEYIFSPLRGFWETAVDPGDRAEKGTILGRLHFPEELEREPEKIVAPFDGYVVGSRAVVPARPGDVLVTYGYEVSVDAIMAGTV